METRKFFNMTHEERDKFFADENVKGFLQRVREAKANQRSLTGADAIIPTVVLDLIRENVAKYSKLIKYVNLQPVSGEARQPVQGTIPEGVWTEMCGKLNELDLTFGVVQVDGYKVGGFVPVCNATLEDTDISLATKIIENISQAIGLALDKAILYGTGTKMPLGIITRLVQTEQPASDTSTIPWKDLHESNVLSIAANKTGAAFFKEFVLDSGAANSEYSRGAQFWAMNDKTHKKIVAESIGFNAGGAVVAGVAATMPVIGGDIVPLGFIPDDVIIGGYGDLYLLAERAGAKLESSEHVKFLEDQTVFKGTARYDGTPVIAEGFVAIGINGVTPNATMTFAADTANNG